MHETAYCNYAFSPSELTHRYGPTVHLLADPILLTQLARLCRPDTEQPDITYLARDLYQHMTRTVLAAELPRVMEQVPTRMQAKNPRGVWQGQVVDSSTRVVTVDIARAGTLPSQMVFEALTRLIAPRGVRQDHIFMGRAVDADGHVTGVSLGGTKIGGPVHDAVVLVPDPMGATGGSLVEVARLYRTLPEGPPRKIVAMHLIVTPEYLRRMAVEAPDVVIYAARLDRGMSPPELMQTPLGERIEHERGLDDRQYIVPGAGGLGEVLNNADV